MQDIAGNVQADSTHGRIRPGREAAGTGKATDTATDTNPIVVARDGVFGKADGAAGSTGEATPPVAGADAYIPAE